MDFFDFNTPAVPVRKKRRTSSNRPVQVNIDVVTKPEQSGTRAAPAAVEDYSPIYDGQIGTNQHIIEFNRENVLSGIIFSEVLGKPRAKRKKCR